MTMEPNGFFEYLQLQEGEPKLLTKSELITQVRAQGYKVTDRKLTFYAAEGLLPRSVRVGSRAGVYPAVVVELLTWILRARDVGTSMEALKELLPVWKFLIQARSARRLDLAELEYVARQHVTSIEGSLAVVQTVIDVMADCCADCRAKIRIITKDGADIGMNSPHSTIGFAIARTFEDENRNTTPQWYASTRISLAAPEGRAADPSTVILGVKPNEALPPDTKRAAQGEHRQDVVRS